LSNLDPFTRIVIIFVTFWFMHTTLSSKKGSNQTKGTVNPAAAKLLILIFLVFAGCFIFPIHSKESPISLGKTLLLLFSYGTISLAMAALYGEKRKKFIYPITLLLTAAGILCRYVFEFEEIVGYTSFSFSSVVVYIAVIPAFTTILYYIFIKLFEKMK